MRVGANCPIRGVSQVEGGMRSEITRHTWWGGGGYGSYATYERRLGMATGSDSGVAVLGQAVVRAGREGLRLQPLTA
jgi:hypothetical protein